jgi:hypothetical protein
LLNKDTGST